MPPAAAEFAEKGRYFFKIGSRWAAVSWGDLFRNEHDSISAKTVSSVRVWKQMQSSYL